MTRKMLLSLPIVLAACGGGGSSGSGLGISSTYPSLTVPATDYAGLADVADDLLEVVSTAELATNVPTSGIAEYSGIMALYPADYSDPGYVGAAVAQMNFGTGKLVGAADGFYFEDGTETPDPVEGRIGFEANGFEDAMFSNARLGGQLTIDGTSRTVSGRLDALAVNDGADWILMSGEEISVEGETGLWEGAVAVD